MQSYTLIRGQAALSLIFLIGGIVILVGVTLAFVALTFLNASYGFQAANRAQGAALAGIHDALLQLARNKDFSDTGYCVPADNLLASGYCPDGDALVVVTQNSPAAGQAIVTADAFVRSYRRKMQAAVSIATSTGAINVISIQTLSL